MKRPRSRILRAALGVTVVCVVVTSACDLFEARAAKHEFATGGAGLGGSAGGAGGASSGAGGAAGVPMCGDGKVDVGETCDDKNFGGGDGCSAQCQVEECWDCAGGTCVARSANTLCNNFLQVCDGHGACGDCVPVDMAQPGFHNCGGALCTVAGDCASGLCVAGVCRSDYGSDCNDSVECASNFCAASSKKCETCSTGGQCSSGSCVNSQCEAEIGEPCDSTINCVSGTECVGNLCKGLPGAVCIDDYLCKSNYCELGNVCSSCSNSQDCGGQICVVGACPPRAVPGNAYCNEDADCLSGICAGFPRKCVGP